MSEAASFVIVMNARSGNRDPNETASTLRRVFEEAGRPYELHVATDPRQLAAHARRALSSALEKEAAIVAVGGDGTLNALVRTVLPTGQPFGAIPQGTFNYFGRNYGLPLETEEAARALLDATPRPVQVGMVNDQVFLVNASLGLYPKILEDREQFKRRHGRSRFAAYRSGITTLLRERGQLALAIDQDDKGRALRTPTLVVGNNRLQLERIGIEEAPAVERGGLVAIAVKPVSTWAMFGLALRGALGRLGDAESIVSFPFRHMCVRPGGYRRARVKVAIDGEITWLRTPLEFRAAPQPLNLLVPRAQS